PGAHRRRRLRALLAPAALGPVGSAHGITPTKHQELLDDDRSEEASLFSLLAVVAILDPPLDVEAVTLLHVLLDNVGQPVPERQPMPLGSILLFTIGSGPLAVGRERHIGHLGAPGRGA